MATKQPAPNLLDANYRERLLDHTAQAGEMAKLMGIPGTDDMIAITADGALHMRSRDDADGVQYEGGAQTSPPVIPAPRALTNPHKGIPGAD